jgi:hypothetical protein
MSVEVRRVLYWFLAVVGFGIMLPAAVQMRTWRARMSQEPADFETMLQGAVGPIPSLLALAGILMASGFLYAALSVGHPRVWHPDESDGIRCRRCGEELRFGIPRCPACDQHLVW